MVGALRVVLIECLAETLDVESCDCRSRWLYKRIAKVRQMGLPLDNLSPGRFIPDAECYGSIGSARAYVWSTGYVLRNVLFHSPPEVVVRDSHPGSCIVCYRRNEMAVQYSVSRPH